MGKKKIGLIDVDGHNFPNIALMKLSAFNKLKGDEVEFATILLTSTKRFQKQKCTVTLDVEPILRANDEVGQRFVDSYYKIVAQRKLDEQDWISELRAQGVKACHPNDGWVNRKENKIHLCYPLFNDGVGVGDKIMLGWVNDKKSERLVEVTKIENSLLTYYHFKDVREAINFIPEKQQKPTTKNGCSVFYIACCVVRWLRGLD